jgi:hypothetical protein
MIDLGDWKIQFGEGGIEDKSVSRRTAAPEDDNLQNQTPFVQFA